MVYLSFDNPKSIKNAKASSKVYIVGNTFGGVGILSFNLCRRTGLAIATALVMADLEVCWSLAYLIHNASER